MIRPYRKPNAPIGKRMTPDQRIALDFHFNNCDVAKYLIARNGSDLKFRNGRPTELYLHSVNCERCNAAPIIPDDENEPLHAIEFRDKQLLKAFRQWIKKNHPSASDESAIKLLIDYYNFAYNTMRPEWIAYKQKYGELK